MRKRISKRFEHGLARGDADTTISAVYFITHARLPNALPWRIPALIQWRHTEASQSCHASVHHSGTL